MTKIAPRSLARWGLWAVVCLSCAVAVTPDAAYGRTPPPCESAVLTLTEAADLLRVDVDDVERLAEQKKIPARRIGSSWRFNCAAVMAWLNGDWEPIAATVAPHTDGLSSFAPPPEFRGPLTTQDMAEVTATGTTLAPVGATTERIVVFPFSNIAGSPAENWIGVGISETIATAFERIARAASPTSVSSGNGESAAIAAGRRLGGRWIVTGTYRQVDDRIRLTARVTDIETGTVVEATTVDGHLDELFAVQDRLIERLRAALTGGRPRTEPDAFGQAETTPSASAPPPADGQAPIGEAPEERTAEDVFLRGRRVLLRRGQVVVDFGQFYSRSDSQQLVSVGNGVGLATLEQEAFITLLVSRIGILDETELFASTTFQNQGSGVLGSTIFASSGRAEFGDIGVGVRHTFLREGVGRPDIIGTLNVRIPTGDTSYAVGGGLVLVKSVDPVVLFASANYLHAVRDFSNVARVAPGDRFDVSIGYGLALNDTLSISMAASGLFTGTTTFDDVPVRRPDFFSGRFGLTTLLARGLYIEPSVSFGLSGPGNSVAFGVTMPYAF